MFASALADLLPPIRVRLLESGEEGALAALEVAAWPGPLQASYEKIKRRMALGHRAVVAEQDGEFLAAVCYIPTESDHFDSDAFPKTFMEFSSLPRSEPIRSTYVYSLGVHPDQRGGAVVRQVLEALLEDAVAIGARYLVADGRCPSYAGATSWPDKEVRADPRFRAAIDRWHSTGVRPSDSELTRDPLLRFYKRVLGCEFHYLLSNFLPEDTASGRYGVIFAKDLRKVAGSGGKQRANG